MSWEKVAYTTDISGGGPTLVRKTADESVTNNAVLQNDDELLLAVGANEVWEILLLILVSAASAIPDMRLAWSIPSGAAMYATITWTFNALSSLSDATTEQTGIAVITTTKYMQSRYLYIGGANAGNAQFQWAQNLSSADALTVYANSFIVTHQLA